MPIGHASTLGTTGNHAARAIRRQLKEVWFGWWRRELEAYASQASKKLDFNTPEEADAVEEVFTNAIQCLSEARKPCRKGFAGSCWCSSSACMFQTDQVDRGLRQR